MNSTTTMFIERTSSSAESNPGRLGDYIQMVKPRISALVLLTVAVGGFVASWAQPQLLTLLNAVFGTALVATSATIWNQWIERNSDLLMERTADRPVATGRISEWETKAVGAGTVIGGLLFLSLAVNLNTAFIAATTWVLYVLAYTPMKRRSSWNTLVGAIPGALPVLIGWSATGRPFDVRAVALFMVVFLWQFPHFMSIAWLYRKQYGDAGIKMITVVDPSGKRAGIQAVVGAMALLPVSLVPAAMSPPSLVYVITSLILGGMFLVAAIRFRNERNDQTARHLMRTSLIYLPTVMLGLACIPLMS